MNTISAVPKSEYSNIYFYFQIEGCLFSGCEFISCMTRSCIVLVIDGTVNNTSKLKWSN